METTAYLQHERSSEISRIGPIFDRLWWVATIGFAPVIVYLNRDALAMRRLIPEYACLRTAIFAGLDPAANHCAAPTFPMWGYGWALALTSNQYTLLIAQSLLATCAAWLFLRVVERADVLRGLTLRLVKLALVVSVPWYAANAVRWPDSVAASLLLIAIAVLVLAITQPTIPYRLFALSGVCFGAVLNFRSDYIGLALLAAALVVALGPSRLPLAKRMGVWGAAILIALAPWMVYSARATGHVLLTSTNSGHVLYISLGQLPNNPWSIQARDGDPRMRADLAKHFGHAASSLTYTSDQYLRSRFAHLVLQHPDAWALKDVWNAAQTVLSGFYNGEFVLEQSCGSRCWQRYGYAANGSGPTRSRLHTLFGSSGLSAVERFRFALLQVSSLEGRIVSLTAFFAAAIALLLAAQRRNLPLGLVALVPAYEWLLNSLAYQMTSYTSMVYVFLVVLLGLAARAGVRQIRASHCAAVSS